MHGLIETVYGSMRIFLAGWPILIPVLSHSNLILRRTVDHVSIG